MNAVADISKIARLRCPGPLRDLPAWVVWRMEPNDNPGGKPRKMPYYANGGRRTGVQGRPEDREALVTFDVARAAASRRGFDGVGFAPLAEFGIVALDFDHCLDAAGNINAEVLTVVESTYAELSPSGNGIRAFFRGQLGNLKAHGEPFGFETFSSKGFVTVTGDLLPFVEILGTEDEVAPVNENVMALVARRFRRELELSDSPSNSDSPPLGMTPAQIDQALEVLPYDAPRDVWLAERRKGVGGSDVPAVLGMSRWSSPRCSEVSSDRDPRERGGRAHRGAAAPRADRGPPRPRRARAPRGPHGHARVSQVGRGPRARVQDRKSVV